VNLENAPAAAVPIHHRRDPADRNSDRFAIRVTTRPFLALFQVRDSIAPYRQQGIFIPQTPLPNKRTVRSFEPRRQNTDPRGRLPRLTGRITRERFVPAPVESSQSAPEDRNRPLQWLPISGFHVRFVKQLGLKSLPNDRMVLWSMAADDPSPHPHYTSVMAPFLAMTVIMVRFGYSVNRVQKSPGQCAE